MIKAIRIKASHINLMKQEMSGNMIREGILVAKILCVQWARFGDPWNRLPEYVIRELERMGYQILKVEIHEIIKKAKITDYLKLLAKIIKSDLTLFTDSVASCFFPPFIFRKVLYLCTDPNLSPYRFRTIRRMKKPFYFVGDAILLPRISKEIVVPAAIVERYFRQLKVKKPITIISQGFEESFLLDPPKKELERLRTKLGCSDSFVFGYLGDASPAEFFSTFLPALVIILKRHPNRKIKVMFVGPKDEAKERLSKLAKSAGLTQDNLIFTGRIPHEQVSRYIALFDVYFNPNFVVSGLAIKELMAQKKTGVSLSGQGEPYIVDGFNIVLAKNNVKDVSEKLERLLLDKQYRDYIASNARNSISSYTWKSVGEKYKELIDRIISS